MKSHFNIFRGVLKKFLDRIYGVTGICSVRSGELGVRRRNTKKINYGNTRNYTEARGKPPKSPFRVTSRSDTQSGSERQEKEKFSRRYSQINAEKDKKNISFAKALRKDKNFFIPPSGENVNMPRLVTRDPQLITYSP